MAGPLAVTGLARRALGALATPLLARRHLLPDAVDRTLDRVRWVGPPPAGLGHAPAPSAPGGLLVGPANFAGQGLAWARAFERSTGLPGTCWAYRTDPVFGFSADWDPPVAVYRASRAWQRAQLELVATSYRTVVIEAGRPLFGVLHGYDPVREARELVARGLRVAMLWHGTDIRLPSEHAATHALSPYGTTVPADRTARLESTARRNRARLERFGGPALVSTPDLLTSVPDARWCPVVVDVDAWRSDVPVLERERPVVAHVPSNAAVKGTDLVRGTLDDLHRAGRIEYREAAGLTADRVRQLYREADVVLDQFRLGIYGVAACEAMAAGRVVLSHVDASVRERVRTLAGRELPVVETPAAELAARLEDVLTRRDHYRRVAAEGVAFVADVHDGRRSAAVLADVAEGRA